MYPVFLEANSVCADVGVCKIISYKKTMTSATCEDCTSGVEAVTDLIKDEDKVAEIITFLTV